MDTDNKWPIDKLPEEVLVEIFSLLDLKDLHKLATVRSDWKLLINGNARTRKKLMLQLDYRSRGSQELQLDDFRYSKIEISDCQEEAGHWDGALGTMRKFSNDLRHLILTKCYLSFNQNMVEVFRSMEKLEVLDLSNVRSEFTFEDIQASKFDNLKKIVIDGSSWHVLKFIGLSQIKSLDISFDSEDMTTSEMIKELVEFLCAQTKLEELKLSFIFDMIIKAEDIAKMNFPLKRLTLDQLANFMGGEENAVAFLERFSNTLEELSLWGHFETSFCSLFKKMQKLQSLKLNADFFPEDENFYETLSNLSSVKKLVIWFDHGDQQGVQGVIAHLQNVETLLINGRTPGNKLMTFVSNNLLKLKNLGINGLVREAFEGVKKFKNLLKLDVWSLQKVTDENWTDMLAAMPNVKQFTIRDCSELNSAKFDAMTRAWSQLRVLNLGYKFVPKGQMFNNLLACCPNITTVHVSGYEADHPAFKDFKKQGLRLIARNYLDYECFEDQTSTSLDY